MTKIELDENVRSLTYIDAAFNALVLRIESPDYNVSITDLIRVIADQNVMMRELMRQKITLMQASCPVLPKKIGDSYFTGRCINAKEENKA